MLAIRVLILFATFIVVDVHYPLYHSENHQISYPIFDCLYAHWIEDIASLDVPYVRNYHLIPYCRQPDNGEESEQLSDIFNENMGKKITFNELNQQGVTSEQLFTWVPTIDVAERYEMNHVNSNDVFYNCSPPWFGSLCQYKFGNYSPPEFVDIVRATFANRDDSSHNITTGTCYRFLNNCSREPWPFCLDWREICDGKFDCVNGEDEDLCENFEVNKCADGEYRCHNNHHCIPSTFAHDSVFSVDCLDGSDESKSHTYNTYFSPNFNYDCIDIPTFRCEERTARYDNHFSCGDGQYHIGVFMPFGRTYCHNNRDKEMNRLILTSCNYISNITCRQAFYCALHANRFFGFNSLFVDIVIPLPMFEGDWGKECEPLSQECSGDWLVLPEKPIMFGFFQFVYLTNRSVDEFKQHVTPDFVCFDGRQCPFLLLIVIPIEIISGLVCCRASDLMSGYQMDNFNQLENAFMSIVQQCLSMGNESSCDIQSHFHCNSYLLCIPYYRVADGFIDCYFGEDEAFSACQLNDSNRFVCKSHPIRCLSPVAIGNAKHECLGREDELIQSKQNFDEIIPYSVLCNGHPHLFIFYNPDTDESDCDWWPCDNPYVHCDNIWDCSNGADELNCVYSPCSLNEHSCKNNHLDVSYCLPVANLSDKYINDCRNSDEFRALYFDNGIESNTSEYYSWNTTKCVKADQICAAAFFTSLEQEYVCLRERNLPRFSSDEPVITLIHNQQGLCSLKLESIYNRITSYLITWRFGNFPLVTTTLTTKHVPAPAEDKPILSHIDIPQDWHCHRGILVLYGINETKLCLCPPSYFGSQCQWQSQRVSLTLQLLSQRTTFTVIIFELIIMLVDEQGQIASNHEQIAYMPSRDCSTKFNIYLLYPDRPKNVPTKNYSVRINLFDKVTLDYWGSWYLPMPFQLLPVNRIATQLFMPKIQEMESCSLFCGKHGKCTRYINKNSLFFCRCDRGYSGSSCNITHTCHCSNDSLCLSSSICVCPLYKFGSYCYLKRSICQSIDNPCGPNGICVPSDDRINLQAFTCVCKEGYSGIRCNNTNNRIDISIDKSIMATLSIVHIHFVTAVKNANPERTTMLKRIPIDNDIITFSVSQPFNILFVQVPEKDYYLTIVRETYIPSEHIHAQVLPKQRCSPIIELFNDTFLNLTYLHRIKYYPLLCRENIQLMCFYDESVMCICDLDRFANCFVFNSTMRNDCQGYNDCQNNGSCFQNNETCPTMSICVCEECYYGSKCHFSTKGHVFSIDPILGYYIKQDVPFNGQPLVIKVSTAITVVICVLGLISGSLSILTFQSKKLRDVGCGNYLLVSSIVSICIINALIIKFGHLILSHMQTITNRSVLFFNCVSIDVILKVLLTWNEWLIACVAIERMINATKGTRFEKKKSKQMAKWIILSIPLLITLTYIHDPLHRQLIEDYDGDEQRVWCFVRYSGSVNIYNSFIDLIHFLVPLSINLISAICIIITVARRRSKVEHKQSFKQHLKQQLIRHTHLLFAPCAFVLLGLPRLIFAFSIGCMKSLRNPWIYLIGYFVSFLPSILTFITFVLPSSTYKKEFQAVVRRQLRRCRREL